MPLFHHKTFTRSTSWRRLFTRGINRACLPKQGDLTLLIRSNDTVLLSNFDKKKIFFHLLNVRRKLFLHHGLC